MVTTSMMQDKTRTADHKVTLTDPVLPEDPNHGYDVVQMLDEQGYPEGYSLYLRTHVCENEDECLPVEITMYWDALGNFRDYEVPEDWPLTKRDHEPFTQAEYDKLKRILKDESSVLGNYTPRELAEKDTSAIWMWDNTDAGTSAEVDGSTGATPITIKNSVIEDAAYTSWTLWWWANGEIGPKLKKLSMEHMDTGYLRKMLHADNQEYVDFALQYLNEHPRKYQRLTGDILNLMSSMERDQIEMALGYLEEVAEDQAAYHQKLVTLCPELKSTHSTFILEYLKAQKKLANTTLVALGNTMSRYSYFQVHLILQIFDKHQWFTGTTENQVAGLLGSDNFFIARRAYNYLMEKEVSRKTKARLEAFQKANSERL